MKNILCTICMRGNSKEVTNKNILKINGKPLLYYSIKLALDSNLFDKIVVSTDSKKISELAQKRVAKVTDVVKEGDEVKVKVIGFDRGKVKLSIKQAAI